MCIITKLGAEFSVSKCSNNCGKSGKLRKVGRIIHDKRMDINNLTFFTKYFKLYKKFTDTQYIHFLKCKILYGDLNTIF